jgi:CMP/dCMP kinase
MKVNVAIDGPSASGKSTIAKALAKKLNYVHIDTGAMYRACAYKILTHNISLDDLDLMISSIQLSHLSFDEAGHICLDGQDISNEIRSKEIDLLTSRIARIPEIRAVMVALQQAMVQAKGFVMDGRDIGSVVLPNAEIKIYQTASIESRAQRRFMQYQASGSDVSYDQIYSEISQRDYNDTHRSASPLIKTTDAYVLDTSNLSIEESVEQAYTHILSKLKEISND